jgi:hypothetical protein
MIYVFLLIMCVVFIELFLFLDVSKQLGSTISLSKEALDVLKSSTIEDEEKEVIIRRKSLSIFKVTLFFTSKFLLIFFILYVIYLLSIHWFFVSEKEFAEKIFSLQILLSMTIVSMLYIFIRNVIKKRL